VDDPELVRRLERVGDLPRDRQRLGERNRPPLEDRAQVLAVDQLHHERAGASRLLEPVDLRDVRVVERRERLRLSREPRDAIRVVGESRRKDLDGDVAV